MSDQPSCELLWGGGGDMIELLCDDGVKPYGEPPIAAACAAAFQNKTKQKKRNRQIRIHKKNKEFRLETKNKKLKTNKHVLSDYLG